MVRKSGRQLEDLDTPVYQGNGPDLSALGSTGPSRRSAESIGERRVGHPCGERSWLCESERIRRHVSQDNGAIAHGLSAESRAVRPFGANTEPNTEPNIERTCVNSRCAKRYALLPVARSQSATRIATSSSEPVIHVMPDHPPRFQNTPPSDP